MKLPAHPSLSFLPREKLLVQESVDHPPVYPKPARVCQGPPEGVTCAVAQTFKVALHPREQNWTTNRLRPYEPSFDRGQVPLHLYCEQDGLSETD